MCAVLAVLVLGLTVGAADPGQALLDAALASHDPQQRERLVRGWATLGGVPDPPAALLEEAHRALSFAMDAGRFRLFASRQGERLKLGLHDPAGIITQLEVVAILDGGRRLVLSRAESDEPGRLDYKSDPSVPATAILEVRALAKGPLGDIEVRGLRLEPHDPLSLPKAPDPNAPSPLSRQKRGPDTAAADTPIIPWWWIAAGAVAAGLVGAAIWQETRAQ